MQKLIHPKPPAFTEELYFGIELTEGQVDISEIERLARAEGYREQTHRHITILNEKTFIPLLNKFPESEQKRIFKEINDLVKETDWSFTPKDIYYVARPITPGVVADGKSKESYIRTVEMPGINGFITKINKILNADIPFRFPHITLFTRGEGKKVPPFYGIPINSLEQFKKLKTKKIT